MKKQKKNKKNSRLIFTLIMSLLFILIAEFGIWGICGTTLIKSIFYYPQGNEVIKELVLAILSLIVMLIFKNFYVFTQKKEKLSKGLLYGLFFILFSSFYTLIAIVSVIKTSSWYSLLNIALLSFLIGICEEFLCRGWLLNEFLERFGKDKKGIWYSIIISGIIFGLMHLGNIRAGQNISTTIIQVINATGIGIVFGTIYYKTKNIWSVIILHAFWDFSLLLVQNGSPIMEMTFIQLNVSSIGIIFSLLMLASQIFAIIPLIKNIDSEPKTKQVIGYSIIGLSMYMFFSLGFSILSSKINETYKYGNINIKEYSLTKDNLTKYNINYNKEDLIASFEEGKAYIEVVESFSYTISSKNNELIIENNKTKKNIKIKCEELIDYIVMEKDDSFTISYLNYLNDGNMFINYITLDKNNLSNSDEFLNNISNNFERILIPETRSLYIIKNYDNNESYITAYDQNYGYYLLDKDGSILRLND